MIHTIITESKRLVLPFLLVAIIVLCDHHHAYAQSTSSSSSSNAAMTLCYGSLQDYGTCLVATNDCSTSCANISLPEWNGNETTLALCRMQDDIVCPILDCCPDCSKPMMTYVQCVTNVTAFAQGTSSSSSSICPEVQCNATTTNSSTGSGGNGNATTGGTTPSTSNSNSTTGGGYACFSKLSDFAACIFQKKCDANCTNTDTINSDNATTSLTGQETPDEICTMQEEKFCPVVYCCQDCQSVILDYFQCLIDTNSNNTESAISRNSGSSSTSSSNPLATCTLSCANYHPDAPTTTSEVAPTTTRDVAPTPTATIDTAPAAAPSAPSSSSSRSVIPDIDSMLLPVLFTLSLFGYKMMMMVS